MDTGTLYALLGLSLSHSLSLYLSSSHAASSCSSSPSSLSTWYDKEETPGVFKTSHVCHVKKNWQSLQECPLLGLLGPIFIWWKTKESSAWLLSEFGKLNNLLRASSSSEDALFPEASRRAENHPTLRAFLSFLHPLLDPPPLHSWGPVGKRRGGGGGLLGHLLEKALPGNHQTKVFDCLLCYVWKPTNSLHHFRISGDKERRWRLPLATRRRGIEMTLWNCSETVFHKSNADAFSSQSWSNS